MFSLPFINRSQEDRFLLGRIGRHKISPRFYISSRERKFHTYVVGLTGRGKSKFLQNCILQDINTGKGYAVIDPYGDLVKDVLKSLITQDYFQAENALDRILYVSPRRRDYILSLSTF